MKLVSGQLYQYLQSVQAYISPPIAAVFLLGILWRRLNSVGAIVSLITGFLLGMGRLIAELNKQSLTGALRGYADINFLHFAILLFVVCSVVLIVASLLTAPPAPEKVTGITLAGTPSGSLTQQEPRRKVDIILTLLLVACVGALWIYFS
jgi:SSS family solute:Na+ symporter